MKPLQEILDHPGGSGDVDWDAYYFAPNSSHVLFPLPPSLSIRVSLDILTHVITFLDSEADRSAVTLVCRDWYRWFGHHRYPDLCIRSRESVNALLSLYLCNERVQRRLKHNRTLKFESGRNVKWRQIASIPLQILATYMPAVRSFVFRGYRGDGLRSEMHAPGFAKILRSFRSLHSLELSGFQLDNFSQFARIILACPSLETLILRDGRLLHPSLPRVLAGTRSARVPHLRRLELCHLEIDLLGKLVDSLVEQRVACCDNVTDLTITEIAGVAAELLTRLLRAIGPSLQRITLAHMSWKRDLKVYHSSDVSTLSLAWNTSIRHLDIELEMVGSDKFNADSFGSDFPSLWSSKVATILRRLGVKPTERPFQLTLTRMTWDIFAKSYSRPVSRTVDNLQDLVATQPRTCPLPLGPGLCRFIICDVADFCRHLEEAHPWVFRHIPQLSLALARKPGKVRCQCRTSPAHRLCRRTVLANGESIARHMANFHSTPCRITVACDGTISPSHLDVVIHILQYHLQNPIPISPGRAYDIPYSFETLECTANRFAARLLGRGPPGD